MATESFYFLLMISHIIMRKGQIRRSIHAANMEIGKREYKNDKRRILLIFKFLTEASVVLPNNF